MRKLLKKNRIKIVHIHNLHGYYPTKVATLFMNVKIIIHVLMDYDFTLPRWQFALKHVSHTVAVSQSLYDKIQNETNKPLNNLSLIENGALDNYTERPINMNINQPLKFLIIGDIEPLKGQYEFIKNIYSKIPFQSELSLAGHMRVESHVNEIRQLIKDHHLNINLLGFVHDIKREIEKADCIISYARSEGLARNLIESMALSKPVVASDVIGNTDVIDHAVNGYKIKRDDYDSFIDHLNYLNQNRELLIEMGQNGRKRFLERYHIKHSVKKIESLYHELLIKKR